MEISHFSWAVWILRRVFPWLDDTRTAAAYWPSSASTGTKKPFLPLLRLESYLLLFYLGEAGDYLRLGAAALSAIICSTTIFPLISPPGKVGPNFQCAGCVLPWNQCSQLWSLELTGSGNVSPQLCAVWFLIILFLMYICAMAHQARVGFTTAWNSVTPVSHPSSGLLLAGLRSHPPAQTLQSAHGHGCFACCCELWFRLKFFGFLWDFLLSIPHYCTFLKKNSSRSVNQSNLSCSLITF